MKKLISILVLIYTNCYSQFKIIVDPTYEPKIKTALYLIYTTDASDYVRLTSECSQIRITNDSIPNQIQDQIIRIPLKIVASSSYNNLAGWLVYQSYYISLREKGVHLSRNLKDSLSLKSELIFKTKLKSETKSYVRQLKGDAKNYWDTNPYEEKIPIEVDSSVTYNYTISPEVTKRGFFQRIFGK